MPRHIARAHPLSVNANKRINRIKRTRLLIISRILIVILYYKSIITIYYRLLVLILLIIILGPANDPGRHRIRKRHIYFPPTTLAVPRPCILARRLSAAAAAGCRRGAKMGRLNLTVALGSMGQLDLIVGSGRLLGQDGSARLRSIRKQWL